MRKLNPELFLVMFLLSFQGNEDTEMNERGNNGEEEEEEGVEDEEEEIEPC